MGIVLSLCDYSGNMVLPWAMAGYECWILDILHEGDFVDETDHTPGPIRRIGMDVMANPMRWLPKGTDFEIVFAFPPCTDLAVSGARWFKEKGLGAIASAAALVDQCRIICEWAGAPWMLENPVGTLSTYWRKPDYTFDPCEFGQYLEEPGDAYTKKTCLWTGNGFIMPDKKGVEPVEGSKMHLLPPSEDRAMKRSETPMGFARAVFEANHERVATEA